MDFHLEKGMIDTHFHGLIMQQKGMDARGILQQASAEGLTGGIDIGLTPGDFAERHTLFTHIPGILFSAGCYPSEVEKETVGTLLDTLHTVLLENIALSAIGEIGLDWHWDYGSRTDQKDLLAGQLELAKEFDLPVCIHNREADTDILDILSGDLPPRGGILHCFSSDYTTAKKLLDLGMYISFAGNLTYKNNADLRTTAAKIPLNRIFLETDSPYLSPQKRRGTPNHPGHIGYTYEVLALVKGIGMPQMKEQVANNFHELFRISAE